MSNSGPSDRAMSGDVGLAEIDLVVQRQQRGHFLDDGFLLGAPAGGRIVLRYAVLAVMQGKALFYQPYRVRRPRTLPSQVIDPLLDDPRRNQSIQIAHDVAVGQGRRQRQPGKRAFGTELQGVNRLAKFDRNITGPARAEMDMLPPPSVIERRMDDQSVLARRAPNAGVARMHEELALLYREQLIGLLRI